MNRLALVDAARGLAIVQMVVYHLCFDLNYFGWIHVRLLTDPAWMAWRNGIVTQFLFLAGVSLALGAGAPGAPSARFWRRWLQIAGCAALVSAGSALLFGPRFIWFGVLHFVACAQLLLRPLVRGRQAPARALALGVLVLAVGLSVHLAVFSRDALSWIGFSAIKPQTEDFVPLLPWLGVMLLGVAVGPWMRRHAAPRTAIAQAGPLARSLQALAQIGRWPLRIYMLHQPILMGVLAGVAQLSHG